jgi:UDP:flavonoid glycosyltransferase YjiC (YdhE family)
VVCQARAVRLPDRLHRDPGHDLRWTERWQSWYQNLRFAFSYRGPDVYVYIGSAGEIPDEPLGLLLPRRRAWAERHCRFVKPVVGFDPTAPVDKLELRRRLGLPPCGLAFLASVGPEGDHRTPVAHLERVFDRLRARHPEAEFVLACPEPGTRPWVRYHGRIEPLHEHFAASDFVLTQSGYGKVTELAVLGVPFLAIPLDHHFEQEELMAHRLRHHGVGRVVTLRDHSPESIASLVEAMIGRPTSRITADDGSEIAKIVREAARLVT